MQKYSNKKIEIQYLVCSSFGHLVSVLYCVVTDVVYDVAMSQKSGSSVHKAQYIGPSNAHITFRVCQSLMYM